MHSSFLLRLRLLIFTLATQAQLIHSIWIGALRCRSVRQLTCQWSCECAWAGLPLLLSFCRLYHNEHQGSVCGQILLQDIILCCTIDAGSITYFDVELSPLEFIPSLCSVEKHSFSFSLPKIYDKLVFAKAYG